MAILLPGLNSPKWRLSGPANGFLGFMDRVAKSVSWPLFLAALPGLPAFASDDRGRHSLDLLL